MNAHEVEAEERELQGLRKQLFEASRKTKMKDIGVEERRTLLAWAKATIPLYEARVNAVVKRKEELDKVLCQGKSQARSLTIRPLFLPYQRTACNSCPCGEDRLGGRHTTRAYPTRKSNLTR